MEIRKGQISKDHGLGKLHLEIWRFKVIKIGSRSFGPSEYRPNALRVVNQGLK